MKNLCIFLSNNKYLMLNFSTFFFLFYCELSSSNISLQKYGVSYKLLLISFKFKFEIQKTNNNKKSKDNLN